MSDLISRQAAIDALGEEPPVWNDSAEEIAERNQWRRDVNAIKAVPSAQPKTGKWIYDGDCYICNKCGTTYSWWADSQTSNYCPNCGAKMLKEGEEHV